MSTHTILRIDASARKNGSISRDLANQVIARLAPQTTLTRDLTKALPQIDDMDRRELHAGGSAHRGPTGRARPVRQLVAELQAADDREPHRSTISVYPQQGVD